MPTYLQYQQNIHVTIHVHYVHMYIQHPKKMNKNKPTPQM